MARVTVFLAREGGMTYARCPKCSRPATHQSTAGVKRAMTAHLLEQHGLGEPTWRMS